MSNGRQRVTDIISINDIESWSPKDIIVISAGTGAGKSYFVKNSLYQYAKAVNKKILFLIHRRNCVDQFNYEIEQDGKDDIIDIQTYQYIENQILHHNNHIDYSRYQYIVSDEFHYFISDANFNSTTDLSLNEILKQENCIKIFMSATGENAEKYLDNKFHKRLCPYRLPPNYRHVRRLTFFHQDDVMSDIAKSIINNGEKGIFFIQSAEKAYKLFKEFKEFAIFNCGSSHKYYKYVDEEQINNMLQNQQFNENLLITTSCFYAGANIIDEKVKSIVADITDIGSLIQCLGRKRVTTANDKVDFYIKAINNQQLGGLMRSTTKQVEMAEYLLKHNTQELLNKYPRQTDNSYIIYDLPTNNRLKNMATKNVNMMKLSKKREDINFYKQLMQEDYGYCKYLARYLGFYDSKHNVYTYDVFSNDYSLNAFLEKMVVDEVILLQRKDRKELINKLNVRRDGRLKSSRSVLNAALKEDRLPYCIEEFETSRIFNGKKKKFKSAWRVVSYNCNAE